MFLQCVCSEKCRITVTGAAANSNQLGSTERTVVEFAYTLCDENQHERTLLKLKYAIIITVL